MRMSSSRRRRRDVRWSKPIGCVRVSVTAVGSDSPGKQELSLACLERPDVVAVDRLRQCAAFGELKHAIDAGLLTLNDAHELGRILVGRGRVGPARVRSPWRI